MNIYEIHHQSKIPMRHLRTLEKLRVLKADKGDPTLSKIATNFRNGNPLSAEQAIYLLHHPEAADTLSQYQYGIETILESLGDVESDALPWLPLGARLPLVNVKDPEATAATCDWLRRMIDRSPGFDNGAERTHAYVAARLFFNVPERHRDSIIPNIKWIMANCRNHESMQRYIRIDASRRVYYHRPRIDI